MAPEQPVVDPGNGSEDKLSLATRDARRRLDEVSAGKPPEHDAEQDRAAKPSRLEESSKAIDVASSSDGVKLLLDGVNSLVDSLPPLLKALEAVAQVHPVVASG